MRRANVHRLLLGICYILFVLILSGCDLGTKANDDGEANMIKVFEKEDFQSIIVGESTFHDVYLVAPVESMQVMSYGGFC